MSDSTPTVYYQDDHVTLYQGDCREVLATLNDKSVDCVITDPPYTERTHAGTFSNSKLATAGGRVISGSKAAFAHIADEDLLAIFGDLGRVTRSWVIADMAYQHAFAYEQSPPPGLRMMRVGVWVKTNPMPQLSSDRPGTGWEAIAYMHRDDVKPKWNGGGKHGNYILPTAQGTGHPTAKPLSMVRDWVTKFTKPGDTILDPFAGSGTTLRAASEEGRKAIGVEAEERYCELIVDRLSQGSFDFGALSA